MIDKIDDIYNHALKDRDYVYQESDWMQAKRMLNLDKHNRRIPLWFWMGVGFISLVAMAHTIYKFGENDQTTNEIIAQVSTDGQETDAIEIEPSNIEKNWKILESQNQAVSVESSNGNQGHSTSNRLNTQTINELSIDISNPPDPIPQKFNVKEAIPKAEVFSNSENTSKEMTDNFDFNISPGSDETKIDSDKKSNPLLENYSEAITRDHSILKKIENISGLERLRINSLDIALNLPRLKVDPILPAELPPVNPIEKPSPRKLTAGIYTAYTLPSPNWSSGLQLEYPLSSHWHIEIGAGLNYNNSYRLSNQESNPVIRDQSVDFNQTSLDEQINIQRLSIEAPISMTYRIKRHHLFSGILLNKPIWAKRTEMSSLAAEQEFAAPSTTLTDPQDQNTVVIVRESSRTNDPELLKWNQFVMLGYGYHLTPQLSLRIHGQYRLDGDQRTVVSSAFADTSYPLDIPKWSARVSVVWQF